jgi:hypothetical protein
MSGVATMYWLMINAPDFDSCRLSSLHTLFYGGSSAPAAMIKRKDGRSQDTIRISRGRGKGQGIKCPKCGVGLEITEDGHKLPQGYFAPSRRRYYVNPSTNAPISSEDETG